jgi:hypothetical protein
MAAVQRLQRQRVQRLHVKELMACLQPNRRVDVQVKGESGM